ncbi:MAG: OB-fold domain-containing protein [Candidatus Rokubacteria bacterium]|nr:OB-fold domain-containing protein [Candidatus Rokubacteria bacterium]
MTGVRCGRCGELAIPPKEFCLACHERAWAPVPLSGEGTITTFTVIRVAPRAHAAAAPYAIALVELAEGVSLLGRIVDVPLEKVAIGLPVRFRPLVTSDVTSVGFGPR